MAVKVAYFTNIAPHYRHRLWKKLVEVNEFEFHFFYDSTDPKTTIRQIDIKNDGWQFFKNRLHELTNYRYKKILFWQRGVISEVLKDKWDIYIFLGDMNVLSTWISVLIAKYKKKPVIFWGHGLYGNENKFKYWVRKIFFKTGDHHLVYNHYAKKNMVPAGFNVHSIDVIYNSLDYSRHKKLRKQSIDPGLFVKRDYFDNPELPVLIFIGRLTKQKKLHLLIEAASKLIRQGNPVNLLIIGAGSEMEQLKTQAAEIEKNVYFYGACYNEEELSLLISNSVLCVSPGNVGLTAIHSLSYGTPVCTHNRFAEQMPEFEAIKDGKTGIFYDPDSQFLHEVIKTWLSNDLDRRLIRRNCYKTIDETYNPDNQIQIFKRVINSFKS